MIYIGHIKYKDNYILYSFSLEDNESDVLNYTVRHGFYYVNLHSSLKALADNTLL